MGMVVPMSPGQKVGTQPQAMPSQTDLLMALAEMHKQGRFDSVPMSTNIDDRRNDKGPRGVDDPHEGNMAERRRKEDTINAVNQSARDANDRVDERSR